MASSFSFSLSSPKLSLSRSRSRSLSPVLCGDRSGKHSHQLNDKYVRCDVCTVWFVLFCLCCCHFVVSNVSCKAKNDLQSSEDAARSNMEHFLCKSSCRCQPDCLLLLRSTRLSLFLSHDRPSYSSSGNTHHHDTNQHKNVTRNSVPGE